MEKRLLLAMVLCLFILYAYQGYVEREQKRWKAAHPELQQQKDFTEKAAEAVSPPAETSPGRGQGTVDAASSEASPAPAPIECEPVVVNTPLYQAVFCAQNGRPMNWRLKNYSLHRPCGCKLFGIGADRGEETGPEGQPWVERIHLRDPEVLPFGLEVTTGGGGRIPLRERLAPDRDRLELKEGAGPARLVFEGRDDRGRKIRRIYTFSPDTYLVSLDIEIEGVEPALHDAGIGIKLTDRIDQKSKSRYVFSGFMGFINGKLEKKKKLKEGETPYYSGRVEWEGFSDKYFLTGLIPVENPVSSVSLQRAGHPAKDVSVFVSRLIYNIRPHLLEGGRARFSYAAYIGPKDLSILKEAGHSLEASVDLGWFGFIAKPLLVVLKFFYRYVHNYGIAIILLTVIIKILFHPLTRKQYESMGQIQKLQPKMQAIREKFKDDKERMNREIMDLYRTHKINPLGGCWPMLLQIPVFFALYRALLSSIELRGAPFMFWIQDLSEKDPCYITPIIMGATMFLQQRMTPASGDPNQQKMMMFMPIIFTFLFLNFPSGLVLYWLVNNVLTIGQQFVSQRRKQ